MEPVVLGSHVAVDFLNTAFEPDGEHIEIIPDGKALLDWMQAVELLDAEQATRLGRRLGVNAMNGVAAEARKFREWARAWLMRWRSAPNRDYSDEVAQLNKLLSNHNTRSEVMRTKQGLILATRFDATTGDALIALLATHFAKLLTQEDPAMLKSCAGTGCTLWFLDRTKAHRRQFCSAATCGNRAKVAAFRERQRE